MINGFVRAGAVAAVVLTVASVASAQTITAFDVPDSSQTRGEDVNDGNTVTGWYWDLVYGRYRFVRHDSNGDIETFDASYGAYVHTFPRVINNAGTTAGQVCELLSAPYNCVIFVREANGTVAWVGLPPGQVAPNDAVAIASNGEVVGSYMDASTTQQRGFLWRPDGSVEVFDADPAFPDTRPTGINAAGTIVGRSGSQGFVRDRKGSVTLFSAGGWTFAQAVGPSGTIAGFFQDPSVGGLYRGFVRDRKGAVEVFDSTASPSYTIVYGLGASGTIAGYGFDGSIFGAFVRDAKRNVTNLPLNILSGYSVARGANAGGKVSGTFFDTTPGVNRWRGFIYRPN